MLMRYACLAVVAVMTVLGTSGQASADSARDIDAGVEQTLARFYSKVGGSHELVGKARAVAP